MKVGIIGAGSIGSELYRRVTSAPLNWDVGFILRSDGVYKGLDEKIDELKNCESYYKDIDLAFLAIPTLDDGKTAFNYMSQLLEKDIPVVTCEKGSLSNYFQELRKWKDKIGYSATVGGGTRMLKYLEDRIGEETEEIHAVVNGTMNFIFDAVSKGRSFAEAVKEAKKLGYAEPGATNPIDVINKESTEDVPMKTAILFNICEFGDYIRAKDRKAYKMKEPELKKLIKEANDRRYIVSITGDKNEEDVIGGFKYKKGGRIISAGFKDINENPLFSELILPGVNNAILIGEGKYDEYGKYILTGPGAGAGPTASAMIKDALNLLK